ncbi:Venom allergen 3 [Armadillidium nasatum]|uniref:Venom allergen 3 n=1 Tax=Armadillidium nasatum TaxID=96803 RepID=A0A5N5TER5_9CRUS|nr:Venom allergen 3 [Armadillidium nasatum]
MFKVERLNGAANLGSLKEYFVPKLRTVLLCHCYAMRTERMLWLTFIAVVANVQNSLAACDYCSSPNNPDHTMCGSLPATPCGTSYTFSASDKAKILQHHNTIRQRAASGQETNTTSPLPPACEMCNLQWNDEAALIAQRHTDKCEYKHDDHRNLCNGITA